MPINPMMRGSVGRSVPSPLSKVISVERGIKNKRRKKIILKSMAKPDNQTNGDEQQPKPLIFYQRNKPGDSKNKSKANK